MTTPTDAEALYSLARTVHAAMRASAEATAYLAANMPEEAQERTREAKRQAESALAALRALGIYSAEEHPARRSVPLEMLKTPATVALVEALGAAVDAARAVDIERGWVDEEGRPCGVAETLGAIRLEWAREVMGAAGRE